MDDDDDDDDDAVDDDDDERCKHLLSKTMDNYRFL